MVAAGGFLLRGFFAWERRLIAQGGGSPLVAPRPAAQASAAQRSRDAHRPADGDRRDVLHHPDLPAVRAAEERVRDRHEACADVGRDVDRRILRTQARSQVFAAEDRQRRPCARDPRLADPDHDDRPGTERPALRRRYGDLRRRLRTRRLAARKRDHVVGRRQGTRRSRWPSGHGSEHRHLARRRADRRDHDFQPEHRLQQLRAGRPVAERSSPRRPSQRRPPTGSTSSRGISSTRRPPTAACRRKTPTS